MLGIVRTGELWATDVRFLNDTKELDVAIEAAREVVNKHLIRSKRTHAVMLGKEMLKTLRFDAQSIYVFSLSESGDALSQWRGYCAANESGYAIGFKFKDLQEWCDRNDLQLSPVIYGTELYKRDLIELADVYARDVENYFPAFEAGEINEGLLLGYASRFATQAIEAAPFIKHTGFSEEKEWRIVRRAKNLKDTPREQYRAGTYSLIPYIALAFPPQDFFASLGLVNVKPSAHADTAIEALKKFIQSQAVSHGIFETPPLSAEISGIPYRPGF